MPRDKAAEQLSEYKERQKGKSEVLTTASGCPIGDKFNSLTIGPRGPILLQDAVYLDELAHFVRV
uniref:Catalase n=1 Tax=Parasteatoda tepidariorum TaxID=114398 RepID=A0A2L2YYR5_PARTP